MGFSSIGAAEKDSRDTAVAVSVSLLVIGCEALASPKHGLVSEMSSFENSVLGDGMSSCTDCMRHDCCGRMLRIS